MQEFNDDDLQAIRDGEWETLLDEIEKGNVVPIIGKELIRPFPDTPERRLDEVLLEKYAAKCELQPDNLNFSQLIASSKFRDRYPQSNVIYSLVARSLERHQAKTSRPDLIYKLLSIKSFPIILTTTFDDLTERILSELHHGEIDILNFCNDPSVNDDLRTTPTWTRPALCYIFGKAQCKNKPCYVLTEEDFLQFSRSWLDDMCHPRKLSNTLAEKYLLVLGCNYPGWLFRFFWHSLKRSGGKLKSGQLVDRNIEPDLKDFLNRAGSSTYEGIEEFIDELCARWQQRHKNRPTRDYDLFLSYSSSDRHAAERIRDYLHSRGVSVWMDTEQLHSGDDYDEKIRRMIGKCRYFAPLLSRSVIETADDNRYYNREWHYAIDRKKEYRRAYILPVLIDGIDLYDPRGRFPREFTQMQATVFSRDEDLEQLIRTMLTPANNE